MLRLGIPGSDIALSRSSHQEKFGLAAEHAWLTSSMHRRVKSLWAVHLAYWPASEDVQKAKPANKREAAVKMVAQNCQLLSTGKRSASRFTPAFAVDKDVMVVGKARMKSMILVPIAAALLPRPTVAVSLESGLTIRKASGGNRLREG